MASLSIQSPPKDVSNTPDYESLLGLVAVKHKAATHTHNPAKLRELISYSYWLTRPAYHYCGDFAWCAELCLPP